MIRSDLSYIYEKSGLRLFIRSYIGKSLYTFTRGRFDFLYSIPAPEGLGEPQDLEEEETREEQTVEQLWHGGTAKPEKEQGQLLLCQMMFEGYLRLRLYRLL